MISQLVAPLTFKLVTAVRIRDSGTIKVKDKEEKKMMNGIYKDYLFDKYILVGKKKEENAENRIATFFSLLRLYNVRIIKGEEYLSQEMILYTAERLGKNVSEPFYKGFPKSVRKLSRRGLLIDQFFAYARTYGLGHFMGDEIHSLFEEKIVRENFKEEAEIKDFSIISEEEANEILCDKARDLLLSTRPLSEKNYELVKNVILDFDPKITEIASRNTAVKLLRDTRDVRFADHLYLSDMIRFLDELTHYEYKNSAMNKLNLKNQDRKFITTLIDRFFLLNKCDLRNCFEKKKIWNGLLHHIHYKPKTEKSREFVNAIRSDKNLSVYSEFEKMMENEDIIGAVDCLKKNKGAAAILRNMNYILSRCNSTEEVEYVFDNMGTKNGIVLMQLLIQYSNFKDDSKDNKARTFKFTKYNELIVHSETKYEVEKRRSYISKEEADILVEKIKNNLRDIYRNKLGKVYIEKGMEYYALPIQDTATQSGLGVLTRGSRIAIGETKKLRAFTYWEKVNDIDLSVFGLDENGTQTEFSWRNMYKNQSEVITYSGDQTRGFNGGSEYFDIDLEKFRTKYPEMRYLIFCDNVYSGLHFKDCVCRAGYMLRDKEDSGKVYEPKTVKSAFNINCESTFAYLFGLDLAKNEFIWLNMARQSESRIAGESKMAFLMDYLNVTDILNMKNFFEMQASELVDDKREADVIVTNRSLGDEEIAKNAQVIIEYDIEKMLSLMN